MRKILSISIIGICLIGVAFCEQEAENSGRDESLTVLSEVAGKFEFSSIAANLEKEDPHHSLALLKNYLTDEKTEAMQAIQYINRVALLHPKPEVRQEVVEILATHYSDPNISHRCYEYLLRDYQADDFSESSKDIIRQKFTKAPLSIGSGPIKLAGVANMKDEIPRLNEIILEDTRNRQQLKPHLDKVHWRYTKTWDARLAKARMGLKEDIGYCVSKIKEDIDNNPRFPNLLLNDLGYIRQPESVELLKKYFLSDRKLPPCYETEEPFASYLMPIMQQNLMGFPELRDIERLRYSTMEEINTCKDWVKNQTAFNIRR